LDYADAVEFLYRRIDYERAAGGPTAHPFRLERTRELFEQLGLGDYLFVPQDPTPSSDAILEDRVRRPKVPLIHIAGTKGKGSAAAMVSEILSTAGYRVGLYTSPHLTDLEERFRIDGTPCRRQTLVDLVEIVAPIVDQFDAARRPVSFFELTTAMAVLHFDRAACDAIVLEVGLGGRLDSTNVCASTVAAITSIGLDHQRVLGDTIAEIAAEKAGILKPGVPVVCGATQPEAIHAIRRTATETGSPIYERGIAFDVHSVRELPMGSEFVYQFAVQSVESLPTDSPTTQELAVSLSLDGSHQIRNAAVAITLIRLLSDQLSVSDAQIARGLRQVRCIGRLERFAFKLSDAGTPPCQIIIDTAHNHDSIVALCDVIANRLVSTDDDGAASQTTCADSTQRVDAIGQIRHPVVIVFGTSRDKDAKVMASELSRIADQVICSRYTTNPRALATDQLSQAFASQQHDFPDLEVRRQPDPHVALTEAIGAASPGGTVIICGSFFLAGQLRPDLLAMKDLRPLQEFQASGCNPTPNEVPSQPSPPPGKSVSNWSAET
jgi:dihydrofolate synthase/folylpolyglutamate synthase